MGKSLEGNKTNEARTSKVICTYCGQKQFSTNLARHHKTASCIGKRQETGLIGRPKNKQEQKEKKQQLSAAGDTQEKVGRQLCELEVMRVPTAADVRKLDVTVVTKHEEVRPRKAPKKPKPVPSDKINKLSFDVADFTASPLISAACEKNIFETQSQT